MRPRSRFMYEWRHMLPISNAFFLLFIFHSFCAYEKSRHCTNIIKCCIDSYKLRYILLSYDVRDQFSISSHDVKRDVCVNVSVCESYIFFNYPILWKVSWIHTHMLGFSIVLCYIYTVYTSFLMAIYMRNPIEHTESNFCLSNYIFISFTLPWISRMLNRRADQRKCCSHWSVSLLFLLLLLLIFSISLHTSIASFVRVSFYKML